MTDDPQDTTGQRLELLERRVDQMREEMELLRIALSGRPTARRETTAPPRTQRTTPPGQQTTPPTPRGRPSRPRTALSRPIRFPRDGTYWLNLLGIGLLLFGLAFLFKYSVDQGWLTPVSRVGFGIALGIVLFFISARIRERQPHLSHVLAGGMIACWYITGFAAYHVLDVFSYPVAFIFMGIVTVLAFLVAVRRELAVLAVIGVLGGFGTPMLLHSNQSSVLGVVTYTCLVLSGAVAIYYYRGWLSLLGSAGAGVWLGFTYLAWRAFDKPASPASLDQWSFQMGVLYSWLLLAAVPVIREHLWTRDPKRWPRLYPKFLKNPHNKVLKQWVDHHAHVLSTMTPVVALWLTAAAWDLSKRESGWTFLAAAGVYAAVAVWLRRNPDTRKLGYVHNLLALMLLTVSACLLFEGNPLIVVLAAEATALHFLATMHNDRVIRMIGHALWVMVLAVTWPRFFRLSVKGAAIVNAFALTDACLIILAAISSTKLAVARERLPYRYIAHGALLLWIMREFSSMENGQGLATIIWGIYAITLLVIGLRRNQPKLRATGLVTLFVTAGKLFLVDLSEVEALWRILLFLGFGGGLLILSYYFRALWKSESPKTAE